MESPKPQTARDEKRRLDRLTPPLQAEVQRLEHLVSVARGVRVEAAG